MFTAREVESEWLVVDDLNVGWEAACQPLKLGPAWGGLSSNGFSHHL
jgi:hypothetical protein